MIFHLLLLISSFISFAVTQIAQIDRKGPKRPIEVVRGVKSADEGLITMI
jgi:hypothetical protein